MRIIIYRCVTILNCFRGERWSLLSSWHMSHLWYPNLSTEEVNYYRIIPLWQWHPIMRIMIYMCLTVLNCLRGERWSLLSLWHMSHLWYPNLSIEEVNSKIIICPLTMILHLENNDIQVCNHPELFERREVKSAFFMTHEPLVIPKLVYRRGK